MKSLFELFLLVAWLIALFSGSQALARRYLGGGRNGTVVSCALVAMFLIGSLVHPTTRLAAASAPGVGAAAHAVVLPAVQPGLAACNTRAATPSGVSRGALDALSVEHDGQRTDVPAGSRVAVGDLVHLHGWVVDDAATGFAAAPCAIVDGKIDRRAAVLYHIDRPDVGAALANAQLSPSGYDISIRAADVGIGHHVLSVGALAPAADHVSQIPGSMSVDVAAH